MTRTADQSPLDVRVVTPFGDAVWVERAEGREFVSRPFEYTVDLLSEERALDFTTVVGKSMALEIDLLEGGTRYVNGVVTSFSQLGRDAAVTAYRAELRPWLWMLDRRKNSRIFQNLSVPDIVSEVLTDYPLAAVRKDVTQSYAAREYCVQYQESDFAFVSRLLEEEGIWYYFDHTADAHTLVLLDEPGKHKPCADVSTARLRGPDNARQDADHLVFCTARQQVVSGKYATNDYDFQSPSTSLTLEAAGNTGSLEVFEHPGRYTERDAGTTIAKHRMEAIEATQLVVEGEGFCRSFAAGFTFTLEEHDRPDLNTSLLLTELSLEVSPEGYRNRFAAIPANVPARPALRTPLPRIYGSQTALVVGKQGEEIWTDEFGRVKLQFHWDRLGASDEKSSAWVRVSQGWAGKSYGSVFIPRIGHEVVVTFLDGDPDRPLVTGAVYNGDNPLPYALPDNQTRSLVKTSSSKGGDGSNELCFDDKAGSEAVYLHAQKDLAIEVVNLETHSVGATRDVEVTGDETHTNKANWTHKVEGDFVLDVTGNITIKAGQSITVEAGSDLKSTAGASIKNDAGTEMANTAVTKLTNDGGNELVNQASLSVTTQSDAQVNVKAGAQLNLEGSAMVAVKGGMVKLN